MVNKTSAFEPIFNAPRYLCKYLNMPSEEREALDPEDLATLAELEELAAIWLKAKGDKNRFRVALLKQGRSARAFSQYTIYEPIPYTAEIEKKDSGGNVVAKTRVRVGAPQAFPVEGSSHAEGIFLHFYLHPDNWQLSGPCQRCGKVFLRAARRPRAFCSRKCATFQTAIVSTKKARAAERARKLEAVNEAIEAWRRAHSKEDWRSYVARRAAVTEKLLTRWANDGAITIPQQKKGR